MTPPNPKRPPRSPRPPGDTASRPEPEVELPFDDDEVAPLQADDPRPQRVPQYPAGPRRRPRRGTGGPSREGRDREMPPRFDSGEYEDPGHSPAFLYVERGPGTGQLIPVKQGVLVLGRASTCDLRLQHPSISRRHAQLTRRGDRLSLKDLGSQNGTYVNRSRLSSEVELHSGDEIALGNALLRVRGPGYTSESFRVTSSRSTSPLRVRMSSRRLMLLAAATGSLVAVILTLAAVRLMRYRTGADAPEETLGTGQVAEAPASEPTVHAEALSVAQETGVMESLEPAPITPEKKVRGSSGTPPLSAQAIAKAGKFEAPKLSGSNLREAGARTKGGHGKAPVKAPSAEPPAALLSGEESEAKAISSYEEGNVEAALSMARRANLTTLATTLARFQDEWSAGNAALAAQDSASAIQHLTIARELDQQISKGWGAFAPRIHKALTQARLQAETRQPSER